MSGPSDDEAALIRAIRADRDADLPRLVYADWLEEHGQPARAEFIRVQCWLSANPPTHPDWPATLQRERALLAAHEREWTEPFRGYLEDGRFDRGFPVWLGFGDVTEFTWVAGELARMTATDRVSFTRLADDNVGTVAGCPALAEVRELETNADVGGLSSEGLLTLVESEYAQALRRLDLSGGHVEDSHLDAALFADEPVLPALEHLHLGRPENEVNVGHLIRLIDSPHRRRLCGLEAWYLRDEDVIELCRCPRLDRFTHLDFGWHGIEDVGLLAIAGCQYLDRLQLLSVGGTMEGVPERAAAALRERFGDRVVIDREVYVGGPVRGEYRRRVVTGRAE